CLRSCLSMELRPTGLGPVGSCYRQESGASWPRTGPFGGLGQSRKGTRLASRIGTLNTTVTQVERRLPPQERAMPAFLTAHHELVSAIAAGGLLLVGFALARRAEGGIATAGEAMIWINLGIGLLYGGIAAWEVIRGLDSNIDVLMVVGAVLAASLGRPEEGALLLFLFVLSGALNDLAMERTRSAVTALS